MADVIKEARINNNLSQAEFARELNVTQPMISAIEKGKKQVPQDLIPRISIVLNDAKAKALLAYEFGAEFFSVPLLKNVDDNPKNVLEVLTTEMFEAGKSIQSIKNLLVNIKPGCILPDDIKEAVYKNEEQIADLYVALKMHFTTMDEAYGVKLKNIEDRIYRKLKEKGYV
jgi:transcriptional regulator with XRE-family HTH domain